MPLTPSISDIIRTRMGDSFSCDILYNAGDYSALPALEGDAAYHRDRYTHSATLQRSMPRSPAPGVTTRVSRVLPSRTTAVIGLPWFCAMIERAVSTS